MINTTDSLPSGEIFSKLYCAGMYEDGVSGILPFYKGEYLNEYPI